LIGPVYRRPIAASVIPALSLHQALAGLAVSTGQCYSPRPEAKGLPRQSTVPVRIAALGYSKSYK
jgi:hypothetical protein